MLTRWLGPSLALVGGLILVSAASSEAAVRLPALISDHMVLQRDRSVKIWGWANPGENVAVTLGDQRKETVTSDEGKWEVLLDPLPAGEGKTLTIKGDNEVVISDVLIGEVWLGAGQSNMEWPVGKTREAATVAQDAAQAQIRVFSVANTPAHEPRDDVGGKWVIATPETVGAFPAVAYEFGRGLQKTLHLPVGIITASIGGTPAESWSSLEALSRHADFKATADAQRAEMGGFEENNARFLRDLAAWEVENGSDTSTKLNKTLPPPDGPEWQDITLPSSWEKAGLISGGAVWFSKRFDLREAAIGKEFLINAGNISYGVRAFLNGKELEQVPNARPMYCLTPRLFIVPAGVARAKDNVLSLRIFTHTGVGQYGYTLQDMWFPIVSPEAGNEWRRQVEFSLPPIDPAKKAQLPVSPSPAPQLTATYNFNGLINPLTSYTLRGVVWYQGESNVERAGDYARLLGDLIADWRARWQQPEMPFYFVQLPNFGGWPTPQVWARMREAQSQVAATVPGAGMVVAIDQGDSQDIHPTNKAEVARRLANLALRKTYGQAGAASPAYQSMEVKGSRIRLKFSHPENLATASKEPLKQFMIAGSDQKFVSAAAVIDGKDVVVSSRLVPNPVAVRYAWSNDPVGCNLRSANGEPVSPFRTDQWNESR